jgi:hypothetical protein
MTYESRRDEREDIPLIIRDVMLEVTSVIVGYFIIRGHYDAMATKAYHFDD